MKNHIFIILLLFLHGFTLTTSSWIYLFLKPISNIYCSISECCNDEYVPYAVQNLSTMLRTKLYGQHIATEIVLYAIDSHINSLSHGKPLVMSFHGANGVGKTYVSRMIAKALYKKGENSKYFHFYYGLQNFPYEHKVSEYKVQLKNDIEAAIKNCDRALFVFDGVDQMPSGLLDALMPFIDCKQCLSKFKKNKLIFILLTNTGSIAIEQHLLKIINNGVKRESTKIEDFEKIMVPETLNYSGGLKESILIKNDAIGFYVPFLPLEKKHVKLCIKEAVEELNTTATKDLINSVFKEVQFGPEPDNLFSKSGCKRVAQIAGRIIATLNSDFDSFIENTSDRTEF